MERTPPRQHPMRTYFSGRWSKRFRFSITMLKLTDCRYAKEKIRQAPQNQSPWNYLRGIYRESNHPTLRLKPFAEEFARLEEPEEVTSSHALDLLAHIYAESKHNDEAAKALELLAVRFDPIRANYWQYRKTLLAEPAAA